MYSPQTEADLIALMPDVERMMRNKFYNLEQRGVDVEGLVNEGLARAWEKRDTYEDGNLKSWMSRVVVNTVLMGLRKHKRHSTRQVPLEEEIASRPDYGSSPERTTQARLLLEEVMGEYESMNETDQTVLGLYLEGRRTDDISQMVGKSVPATKSRLHRVREKLRAYNTLDA